MALSSRVLLDTSAYSALRRGNQEVLNVVQHTDRIVFTPIVIGELLAGFRKGHQTERNEAELARMLESARVSVVEISRTTAECYALVFDGLRRIGKPIPENDIWISASAMEHGLPIVTADRHFEHVSQVRTHILAAS